MPTSHSGTRPLPGLRATAELSPGWLINAALAAGVAALAAPGSILRFAGLAAASACASVAALRYSGIRTEAECFERICRLRSRGAELADLSRFEFLSCLRQAARRQGFSVHALDEASERGLYRLRKRGLMLLLACKYWTLASVSRRDVMRISDFAARHRYDAVVLITTGSCTTDARGAAAAEPRLRLIDGTSFADALGHGDDCFVHLLSPPRCRQAAPEPGAPHASRL